MATKGKSKNGTRKIGRNKISCERYTRENRRIKNKIKKLKKLLKKQPNNKQIPLTLKPLLETAY